MRRKEDGKDYERVYVGSQNETEAGEACIDWAEVTEDFSSYVETRGHNQPCSFTIFFVNSITS